MLNFFRENIQEIKTSKSLRFFGAAMAATHVVAYFLFKQNVHHALYEFYFPNYWPFLSFLRLGRPVAPEFIDVYFAIYFAITLVAIFLFIFKETFAKAACGLLLVATILKFLINIQDFNLMGNYHYVSLLVTLVYLFFPNKKSNVPLSIVLIYFSAGLLKVNWEWISGSALFATVEMPKQILMFLCGYVVILELLISWALLFSRKYFWFFFVQFVGFHLFSWKLVGAYYPLIMFLMLSYFLFIFLFNETEKFTFKNTSSKLLVVSVLIAQFATLVFPGESRLTGEGRVFSLNMFDSLPVCKVKIIAYKNGEKIDLPYVIHHGARTVCDPLVFFNYTKALCRKNNFESISVNLKSRMTSEKIFKTIIDEIDFCSETIQYSVLRHNTWIRFNPLKEP